MKIQCNVCEAAEATVLCCADEAALCWACDEKVHAANKLAGKHQREASGFFFCLRDRALLSKLSASGMLVQDPSKESKHDDVDEIFNQARQLGDVEGPLERPSSSRSFTGIGRLLSGESVPTTLQQPDPVIHNIIFWSNGFTVDDGPLRKLDDPENASFVDSIRKSECPKELEPADKRAAVHVNLMRRDENCPEKEKLKVAFEGVGRTLGGASSSTSSSLSNLIDAAAVPSPSQSLVVDETLPSTSIQLRLADGTRMVAKFNNHHTVKDIRAFIDISRPGNPNTYILQVMGFPPKPLSDPSQTIDQACLANSVVIQKF